MSLADLKEYADIFERWKEFKTIQATLETQLAYYQDRADFLLRYLDASTYKNRTAEELKYISDMRDSLIQMGQLIIKPIPPDSV